MKTSKKVIDLNAQEYPDLPFTKEQKLKAQAKAESKEPKPMLWVSCCSYSLASKNYTEENREFNLAAKTHQGLVDKIQKVYEDKYLNSKDFYMGTELTVLNKHHELPTYMVFSAAYIFGPECRYYISLRPIFKEDL